MYNIVTEQRKQERIAMRPVYIAYSKQLKKQVMTETGLLLKVSVSLSKLLNPYIMIRTADGFGGAVIPNVYRQKIIRAIYPNDNTANINKFDTDIHYGNIMNYSVTLKYSQWIQIYPDNGIKNQEGATI